MQSAVSPSIGVPGEEDEDHKINTPLAAMLPPELADRDVKELFPEFRPGQVRLGFMNLNQNIDL